MTDIEYEVATYVDGELKQTIPLLEHGVSSEVWTPDGSQHHVATVVRPVDEKGRSQP